MTRTGICQEGFRICDGMDEVHKISMAGTETPGMKPLLNGVMGWKEPQNR